MSFGCCSDMGIDGFGIESYAKSLMLSEHPQFVLKEFPALRERRLANEMEKKDLDQLREKLEDEWKSLSTTEQNRYMTLAGFTDHRISGTSTSKMANPAFDSSKDDDDENVTMGDGIGWFAPWWNGGDGEGGDEEIGDKENVEEDMKSVESEDDYGGLCTFLTRRLRRWVCSDDVQNPVHNDANNKSKECEEKIIRGDVQSYEAGGISEEDLIASLLGPRAALLLLIPFLAPLSVFAVEIAASPIFVSRKASRFYAPLLVYDSFNLARKEELVEGNHRLSAENRRVVWTVVLKSVSIFWKKSRLPHIVVAVFNLAFVMAVVLDMNPTLWLMLSLAISGPMIFLSMIDICFVYLGLYMNIHDHDLLIFFKWSIAFREYYQTLLKHDGVSGGSDEVAGDAAKNDIDESAESRTVLQVLEP